MLNPTRHEATLRVTKLVLGAFLLVLGQAALAVDYCYYQYRELSPGEEFCGIKFTTDGKISVTPDSSLSSERSWAIENIFPSDIPKLRIFPGAPDGRTRLIVNAPTGEKWFLLDTKKPDLTAVDTGVTYGPGREIAWSPDSKHAVVEYGEDGFNFFLVISAESADTRAVFVDDQHHGFVNEATTTWLDPNTLQFSAFNCRADRPGDPSYVDHDGYPDVDACAKAYEPNTKPQKTYEATLTPRDVEIKLVRIGTQQIDATAQAANPAQTDGSPTHAPPASTSGFLTVEGTTVKWSAPHGRSSIARFTIASDGYENTYQLDCKNRQFLWTENRDARTRQLTDNTEGATWRPMSANSIKANAIFGVACSTSPTFASSSASSPSAVSNSAGEIPATCPNPQLTNLDHGTATILAYYLREGTQALRSGHACIAALRSLNEAQSGTTRIMEYQVTLRFPNGHLTECINRPKSSAGGFGGFAAVMGDLNCVGNGPYPPIPVGGTHVETGVVRF